MKIVEKIQERSSRYEREPRASEPDAREFQALAIKAIITGRLKMVEDQEGCKEVISEDWDKYMRQHATTVEQLRRLRGEDEEFNSVYGNEILAYIVANGACGIETRGRTLANLDDNMIRGLDEGLPDSGTPL